MSPTFNPLTSTSRVSIDDYVLVEKFCLQKYQFSHGDVVVFCSPTDHKEKHVKRITALPGDWISSPYSYDAVRVPEGHCWVEGDNFASSLDSRSFGPIPLGLVQGRVTHIVWPPRELEKWRQEFLMTDSPCKSIYKWQVSIREGKIYLIDFYSEHLSEVPFLDCTSDRNITIFRGDSKASISCIMLNNLFHLKFCFCNLRPWY